MADSDPIVDLAFPLRGDPLPLDHGMVVRVPRATKNLNGHRIMLGAPVVYPLLPSAELRARWVTIRGFHEEPEAFAEALRRQIETVPELEQAARSAGIRERKVAPYEAFEPLGEVETFVDDAEGDLTLPV